MKFLGILVTLVLAAAAVLAFIHTGLVWAIVLAVASITIGAITVANRKKADAR